MTSGIKDMEKLQKDFWNTVNINDDLFSGIFRRNGEGNYHCTKSEVRAYRNRHTAYRLEHVWDGLTDEIIM